MPDLVRMTIAERERYVRWWIEESGLTRGELRDVAARLWSDRETVSFERHAGRDRRRARSTSRL